jgi:hypothetical protein
MRAGEQSDLVIELNEQQIIEQMTGRLVQLHAGVEPEEISRVIHEELARFEGRPIREYIPLFVERNAKTALAKLGDADRPLQETAI